MASTPQKVHDALEHRIIAGMDLGRFGEKWSDQMLISVTEKRTRPEMDEYVKFLSQYRT